MAPVLGYWLLRGRAQPIRLFLEYLEEPYEEKRYGQGDVAEWQAEKTSINLDFPNLPYYIDGDFCITQSMAIIRYLADKHNLLGNDPKERAYITMLEGAVNDLRSAIATMAYSAQMEKEKASLVEKMPDCLKKFEKYLESKPFLMGDKNLPRIKAYMESDRFVKWPLHAWFAAFGGGTKPPLS
ncbi:unnamed protein product [Echinostoma caproni]|uniref:glutathione transferase n=1 Tax=Echinostoma caproni TaxID=27848 RepID=A0A183A8C0_9TREM|nr:unnamed protein product [Echinostoma caproni]